MKKIFKRALLLASLALVIALPVVAGAATGIWLAGFSR